MKVLWQESETEWVPYDPIFHLNQAWIFIYWDKEEILLVGWSRKFEEQQPSKRLQHRDLYEWSNKFAPRRNPDGAGRIWQQKIDLWGSGSFNLITPKSMRPKILKALGIKE